MTKQYAEIRGGKVTNLFVSEEQIYPDWVEAPTANVGDLYEDGVFTRPTQKPPAPLPEKRKDRLDLVLELLVQKNVLTAEEVPKGGGLSAR